MVVNLLFLNGVVMLGLLFNNVVRLKLWFFV